MNYTGIWREFICRFGTSLTSSLLESLPLISHWTDILEFHYLTPQARLSTWFLAASRFMFLALFWGKSCINIDFIIIVWVRVQFSSVAQSCPTLCGPMNHSMPGLPVHHQLPEFTQTHLHRVSDAIQPSHPLSSPSPPAPNPSQHQSFFPMSQLFAWGGQSTGVSASASFPPRKFQGWSPSEWTGWISLQSKGLPRVFSNTTVQKHQFFGPHPSSTTIFFTTTKTGKPTS